MAVLPVRYYPDPYLRRKADRVENFNDDIREAAQNMLDSANHYPNTGAFAANQLGVPWHILIITCDTPNDEPLLLINLEITWKSDETYHVKEGCMSFPPGFTVRVERSQKIKIKYQDINGNTHEMDIDSHYLVRCIQHELDHLNGIVMTDYLSPLKRKLAEQKILIWRAKQSKKA